MNVLIADREAGILKNQISGSKMNMKDFRTAGYFFSTNTLKRSVKNAFLFCVSGFLINLSTYCQISQPGTALTTLPVESGEKVRLFTDRNIYGVNEKIYFTAGYSCIKELDTLHWSNVLYVELIRWNGMKLVQMKLKLAKPGTSGSMEIPGNIPSGNYYLRAYTKWMRNFSVQGYSYLPVKIVNPFRSEKDEGPEETTVMNGSTINLIRINTFKAISCTISKNEFRPGEMVSVDLYTGNRSNSDIGGYCVSVAKAGVVDTTLHIIEPLPVPPEKNSSVIEYLPEIRGFTVSGKVIDKPAGLPVNDIHVSLSETQNGEYFAVYHTNSMGRFVFSLPEMKGKHDFYIQADPLSEILIDNDFCNRPVKLPFIPFTLKDDEIERVKELVINMQLSQRFMAEKEVTADRDSVNSPPLPFYGSKMSVYKTEKYIELPNIEEFISDVILEAEIKTKKGKVFLTIKKKTSVSDDDPPLILFDNIQIDNNDLLLKTPLNRIEKVEVADKDYIVGDMKYSGVFSIFSKNKDFAGLELNRSGLFFTGEFPSEEKTIPDFGKRANNPRLPDRRNLLYWNPDIHLTAGKKTTISFYASDIKGDYIVYIRGMNSYDQQVISGSCYFSVR
jgi:hypothetical protein